MKLSTLAVALTGSLFVTACGSNPLGSNPIGPSGTLGSRADLLSGGETSGKALFGGTCRVFPTLSTMTTTSAGLTATSTQTCSLSGTQASCTSQYSDTAGTTSTITSLANYASVDDIVDEVQVVPPLIRTQSVTSTTTGTTGVTTSTVTYSYDGQRRIVQQEVATAAGNIATVYSAWDAAGRATLGTTQVPGLPFGVTMTIAYDDGARTATYTSGFAGFQTVSVLTYDTDGNLMTNVTTGAGQTSTLTVTNLSTGTVCK